MELILRKPMVEDKVALLNYKQEFLNNNMKMDGSSWFENYSSIEEWLAFLKMLEHKETVPNNLVPSLQFVLVDKHQSILGMINLRLELNEYLSNVGGHVGYSILPTVQGMGFGKQQLALLLPIAMNHGLSRLLLTCHEENIASRKIIEANGGRFIDRTVDISDNKMIRKYWIFVDEVNDNV